MKTSNLTRLFSTAAVLGALAIPATQAQAQENQDGLFIPGASAEVTIDYVSQYFFRGFEQLDSDQGVVIQPGASLTLDVSESDDIAVTATVGTWGSIHSDTPGAGANPSSWYEQDVYGSVDATSGDFSMGVGLTYYTFPSSAANGDITELNLYLGYDDSDLLGDFAFSPYVAVAIELQNNVAGGDELTYLELGGEFALSTEGTAIEDWSWSVPFAFGLSLDDYYTDTSGAEEFFGYFQVGLSGSIALSELIGYDEWFGAWDLGVGFHVLLLNSGVALTDSAGGSSDNIQYFVNVGLSRSW